MVGFLLRKGKGLVRPRWQRKAHSRLQAGEDLQRTAGNLFHKDTDDDAAQIDVG